MDKYYIVRGDRSGVFFGQIAGRNGQEVELRNVRKLWYWDGACAVEQLAVDGVTAPANCKFTVVDPEYFAKQEAAWAEYTAQERLF